MLPSNRMIPLLLACLAASPSLAGTNSQQLPTLKCTLSSQGNPNGATSVTATGNIILDDLVLTDDSGETTLGLIPSMGFTNFQITGAVYGYRLSSGEVHVLMQIFLDGEVQDTKIVDVASAEDIAMEHDVKGIPVSLKCLPRVPTLH